MIRGRCHTGIGRTNPTIPAAFRDPGDSGNPNVLYNPNRDSRLNLFNPEDLNDVAELPDMATELTPALDRIAFNTMSETLESGPHDTIHSLVGGGRLGRTPFSIIRWIV